MPRFHPIQDVWYDLYMCVIGKVVYENHILFVLFNPMTEKYARMIRRNITYDTYYYSQFIEDNQLDQTNLGKVKWMTIKDLRNYLLHLQ